MSEVRVNTSASAAQVQASHALVLGEGAGNAPGKAIASTVFRQALEKELQGLGFAKRRALMAEGGTDELARALREVALDLMLELQEVCAEPTAEMAIAALAGRGVAKKLRKRNRSALENLVERRLGASITAGQLAALVGELRKILGVAIAQAVRAQGSLRARRYWRARGQVDDACIGYLSDVDVAKLSSAPLDLEHLRSVARVSEPQAPVGERRSSSLRRTLALTPVRKQREADTLDRELVALLRELLGNSELCVQSFVGGGARIWIERLRTILSCGHATLVSTSCPDYSGALNERGLWQCNFKELGEGIGFVATRGIPWIAHAHAVLSTRVRVEVVHYEPSFELASGFQGERSYTPAEARGRLRASSQAVVAALASRGVIAEGRLTCDVLSDEEFLKRRREIAPSISARVASGELSALAQRIHKHRKPLYDLWFPSPRGESAEQYQRRLMLEVIPEQIADYIIAGQIMMQEAPERSLMLAYDSPFMCEVHVQEGHPVLFGRARSLGYAN